MYTIDPSSYKSVHSVTSFNTSIIKFTQVSFNPKDNAQICVIGEKLFKLFRYSEGTLKQFAFTKADPQNYLCQTWLSEDRLLLGTDAGKIQLFEVADLKNEFYVNPTTRPSTVLSKLST